MAARSGYRSWAARGSDGALLDLARKLACAISRDDDDMTYRETDSFAAATRAADCPAPARPPQAIGKPRANHARSNARIPHAWLRGRADQPHYQQGGHQSAHALPLFRQQIATVSSRCSRRRLAGCANRSSDRRRTSGSARRLAAAFRFHGLSLRAQPAPSAAIVGGEFVQSQVHAKIVAHP